MHYFSKHPRVFYDLLKDNRINRPIDITRRITFEDFGANRKWILYDYSVKDNDRPDMLAYKYYGDSTLDWVIFLTNNIIDPYYDWPLNQYNLEQYITQKYGSISTAQGQVHHYEWIATPASRIYNSDGELIRISEQVIRVDLATYNTLSPADRRIVYSYDHEIALNEKKRNIKILDKAFIPDIKDQFNKLFA